MMNASLARFLLFRAILPAAVGNVVINALVGAAIFQGEHVPLLGSVSVGADTLVGSFLIGFLTLVGMVPGARLEARSGRVRGFGLRSPVFEWPGKHLLPSAVAFGLLVVLLCGVPTMKLLVGRGAESMPRDAFLLFKVAYAGTVGVVAAVLGVFIGLAPVLPVGEDPRRCLDPGASHAGPVYPLDYMDKAALAVTDRVRGCSGTPTWELRVRGALDPEHVRRALADTVARYPLLATKVQSLDGVPPVATKYRYARDPAFDLDAIFEVVDVRSDPASVAEVTRGLRSRHTDLFTDFPLTLTLVVTSDDACRLVFRQHHAIADGRAFIGLLVDFAAYLNAARAGLRPSTEALVPIGRRGELEALGLSPLKRAAYTIGGIGWLLGSSLRNVVRPVTPLTQNRSSDYSGENGTLHWAMGDAVLGPWNAARKRFGVSLNTLLTGTLMVANQRVHRARGLPLGRTTAQLLMETRPRDGGFVSFANHLTFLEAEADLSLANDSAALFKSIQAQVADQRDRGTPFKRLLIERAGVLFLPLEQLQRIIFETKRPAYNLNFSNLIALEFPTLEGEGWQVEDVLITTPVAPRHGIVLTVIHYAGKVTFNFNYKSTAATREATEELCREFELVLRELTEA